MPSFRGIEISIIACSEVRRLPEYPHPDGSSVRLMRVGTGLNDLRNGGRISPHPFAVSSFSDADPTRQKKVNPRISVYIPSSPGDQFRLRYLINQSSLPSRFVFFKMLINGHHTVSWGIDTTSCSLGSVTRSLYEPGESFRDKNGDPVVGIETRYLHFKRDPEKKSGDEEGGLIEVQVFRCRGRKRIAVVLDPYPHRNRDHKGITSSSGGLVDNPQDASFYEYHLEDARDSPYATFCFHYRSMKYLEQLNIIPQHETGDRPVSMDQNGISTPDHQEDIACGSTASSFETRVFDDDIESVGIALSSPPKEGEYSLKSPPQLTPIRPASMAIEEGRLIQDEVTSKIPRRPLPEPPQTLSGQVSRESIRSSCPSLTPSLKQYVESEEFENEEIQLSVAQPVFIPSASMQALELGDTNIHDQGDNSFSDYAASPSSTETSQSLELPPSEGYLPTTGSVLERHLNQFESPITQSSPMTKTKLPTFRPEGALASEVQLHEASTLKLTEAEWLRQNPSPERRRGNLIQRLWSPRQDKRAGRSSMVELPARKGEAPNLKRSGDEIAARSAHDEGDDECTDEVPAGNWI
ncbi:hypothetical protein F4781DRAFT_425902 [Annulohypoxylon bovei var. microspora]|nr:hypothetical protein F4781DRAFT_425902 [Annulohypoxylon bovei var. microspora]